MLACLCARPSSSGLSHSLGNRLMSRPTCPFLPHCFYSDSCSLSTALSRPTPIRPCTADRQTIHSWLLLPSSSDLNNDTGRDQQRKHIHLSIADNSNIRRNGCLCVKPPTWESPFKTLRLLPGLPSLCTVVRPTPRLGRVFCHAFFAPLCFLATPRAPIMQC